MKNLLMVLAVEVLKEELCRVVMGAREAAAVRAMLLKTLEMVDLVGEVV
jgi:hypothetical protein